MEKYVKAKSKLTSINNGVSIAPQNEKYAYATVDIVLRVLPQKFREELLRLCARRCDYPMALCEIYLRENGRGGILISGEEIPIFAPVSASDLCAVLDKITRGSAYAYRRELSAGYVMLPYGIRVGICADAVGGRDNLHSLIFRLPLGKCTYSCELFDIWTRNRGGGMLLFSPPACGKTTAMRDLVSLIAMRCGRHVVVVDERGEFIREHYRGLTVDILSGYSKARGIEIAQRTLAAEIIAVDEIASSDECEAILAVGFGGVSMLATAHAGSRAELFSKKSIAPLINAGVFSCFVRLFREGAGFFAEVEN